MEPPRAPTLAGSLQPYQTPTASVTPLPATPIPTQTPLPTPTPQIYTVKSGDTMGSIALDFGLDMGNLVNANPDVSPYAMSIGQALVIPSGVEAADVLPTIEPLALELSPPNCYATLSGGMWCFVLVKNNENKAVENISVEVRLVDGSGELLAKDVAFTLVEHLAAGDALPALTYFENVPATSHPQAELLTAFEIEDEAARYLPVSLQGVLAQVSWDGKSAEISGEVLIEGEASRIWVVATAYDVDDAIVGVRRWESLSGEVDFSLTVASLGPAIERVLLSVEAQR
ncbi:MAG: LysM peptidoglycan-binding domain-containing protein [Anaerolineae bacterium]|nr:LysM peptidoglycan-binding domain-containing protein [Anaerolineae bacterium]MBT7070041.1 LysM peptidoglycan-binding domain-containing protein [Anaerolineae bacterium]MBT7323620.1 LysM peptidoglycan-binding domain-containing protein [Anaerolineae bacterium]